MRIQGQPTVRKASSQFRGQPLTTKRYWDWSLDAQPNNNLSTAVYDTVLFSNTEGFGGNGNYLDLPSGFPKAMADMFNGWGRSGGGCVQEGPFIVPNFHVNIGEANGSSCLRRDFMPGKTAIRTSIEIRIFRLTKHPAILHGDADPKEVQKVLDQPDFASFDRQMEGEPAWFPPAIHAGGHFGIGGMLGQAGNAANSPGGETNPTLLSDACSLY